MAHVQFISKLANGIATHVIVKFWDCYTFFFHIHTYIRNTTIQMKLGDFFSQEIDITPSEKQTSVVSTGTFYLSSLHNDSNEVLGDDDILKLKEVESYIKNEEELGRKAIYQAREMNGGLDIVTDGRTMKNNIDLEKEYWKFISHFLISLLLVFIFSLIASKLTMYIEKL